MITARVVRKQLVEVELLKAKARLQAFRGYGGYQVNVHQSAVLAEIQALEAELAELNKPVSPLT